MASWSRAWLSAPRLAPGGGFVGDLPLAVDADQRVELSAMRFLWRLPSASVKKVHASGSMRVIQVPVPWWGARQATGAKMTAGFWTWRTQLLIAVL